MIINKKAKNQNSVNADQIANLRLMEKRVNKLTTRLWAGLFILFIMIASGILLFANFYYEQLALALTGNYTMTSGDLLTAGDWNALADDFVHKSGDTMSGDLTVNGNITAKQINANENLVVDGKISAGNDVCVGNKCLGQLKVYVDKNDCVGINEPDLQNTGCPNNRPVLNKVSAVCGEGTCPSNGYGGYCCSIKIKWQ